MPRLPETAWVSLLRHISIAILLAFGCGASAHAGPPFQTDDPEPIEYKHTEMYAFTLVDSTGRNAGGTVLEVPAYEVNYGALPNVHLHLVIPMTTLFQPMGGDRNFGVGDIETGVKLRFIQEGAHRPQVGIFPFFELPTGSVSKGLGVGSTWYRMPMWTQKSWGAKDRQWTSYGGGGETVFSGDAHAAGYANFPFAGWLVQKQLNRKLTLAGELFGHGAEGQAGTSEHSATMLDAGGIYEFRDGFDLLFCGGRSVHGEAESYGYLALYWTWGPKDAGQGEKSSGGSKMLAAMTKMHGR
jgi:outer membrane putative beta-barrel porin/alpha-amylase